MDRLIAAQRAELPYWDDDELLNDEVLQGQVAGSLQRAVGAADRHAEVCISATKALLKRASMLSRCLKWLKTVRIVDREVAEFRLRLVSLSGAAEALNNMIQDPNSTVRDWILLNHGARAARSVGLLEVDLVSFEQQCKRICEVWADTSQKLLWVVSSMDMRAMSLNHFLAVNELTQRENEMAAAAAMVQ